MLLCGDEIPEVSSPYSVWWKDSLLDLCERKEIQSEVGEDEGAEEPSLASTNLLVVWQ